MNTNNLDGPMECEDCGKVCQGIQGIRGHRRGCPGREPVARNQEREVDEPARSLDHASNQQIVLGTRLDHASVEMGLRLHDEVKDLRERIRDSLPIRKLTDPIDRANKWPCYVDWYHLGTDIARIELAIEQIVQQARVGRHEIWTLYQTALAARNRWIDWRRQEAGRAWDSEKKDAERAGRKLEPERREEILSSFAIDELETAWEQVIAMLRYLVSRTRATL